MYRVTKGIRSTYKNDMYDSYFFNYLIFSIIFIMLFYICSMLNLWRRRMKLEATVHRKHGPHGLTADFQIVAV